MNIVKFLIVGSLLIFNCCNKQDGNSANKNIDSEQQSTSANQTENQQSIPIALTEVRLFTVNDSAFVVNEKKNNYITTERIIKNKITYYTLDEILAKPGEMFLLIFNDRSFNSEHHNWVLMDKTYKEKELLQILKNFDQGTSNELSDSNIGNNIISQTGLLMPGNTAQINFTAPDQKGRYSFFCSVPGHYKMGEKGYLVVE